MASSTKGKNYEVLKGLSRICVLGETKCFILSFAVTISLFNKTHHFILMIHADSVLDEALDDLEVSLGGGALEGGVTGLENKDNGL